MLLLALETHLHPESHVHHVQVWVLQDTACNIVAGFETSPAHVSGLPACYCWLLRPTYTQRAMCDMCSFAPA